MAGNLKKFVNPRFIKTIDLTLMRALLARHAGKFKGFSLDLLDQGLAAKEREMLYLRIHPLYRNLHPEKRFWQIVQQMRLAEA